MKPKRHPLCFALLLLAAPLAAQVPNLIPHQGRVAVNGVNFEGTGQFKFALVNAAGSVTYWSNNGSSTAGSQPTAAVSLPVTKGLYSAMLGDTSLANMTAVPASVYTNADLRLRVWFNDGTLGFQHLTPDQRLAPNGYLPDGAITSAKLAPGATPPAVQVAGTSQDVVPNTNYIATGSGTTTFHLPASAAFGDAVNISGSGTGSVSIWDPNEFTPRGETRLWLSVASSSDGTKLIAAANGEQLYTSTDAGVTWTPTQQYGFWQAVASSADGTKLIAAAGRLFTSTDAGVTWTPREDNRSWSAVASSSDGTKLIAAVNGGHLYTSTDAGATWTPREQNRDWKAVASSADGTKLIASVANGGRLYTSADAGVTWTPREQFRLWEAVASSADGTKLIAATLGDQLFTSTDAGVTWTPREQFRYWISVASSADGTKLIAAESGGRLFTSADAGVTWKPVEQNRNWSSVASSADGRKLIGAEAGGQLHVTGGEALNIQGTGTAVFMYGNAGWTQTSPGGWTPSFGNLYRSSGNIGIGTATPNYPLSFGAGAADTLLALYDPGTTGAYGLGIGSGQFRLHLGENLGRFSFLDAPAGNELMTIQGGGRVGIGTASPATALHVNGVITGDGSGLTNMTVAQMPDGVALRSGGNAFTGTQTITNGGRVGIGTGTPNYPLSFGAGAGNTLLALYDPGATGAYGLGIGSGQFRLHLGETAARFSFLNMPDGTELMTIGGDGRVGIGTVNPVATLQVSSAGDSGRPQLQLTQAAVGEWSRIRMQASGPAWDIALGPGAAPVMNFYNGSATVLSLGQDGDATLQRNLNFTTGPLRQMVNLWNGEHGMGVQAWTTYFRTNGTGPGAFAWYRGGVHADGQFDPGGGEQLMRLDAGGLWVRNTFVSSSDRNRKENFQPVNAREVLEKVAALPVSRWNYKDDPDTPHIGPMAQDFHAAFRAGADDKHIAMVDADGVALAAIKGLNEKLTGELRVKDREIATLRKTLHTETTALKEKNQAMEQRLAALEEMMRRTQPVKLNSNHQEVTP